MTGASGFVGSVVARRLARNFELLDLYHRTPAPADIVGQSLYIDLSDRRSIDQALRDWRADALLHIAAAADVDACEAEREDRSGNAYQTNAVLPGLLARTCRELGIRFVHISTDYVYDGVDGPYHDMDLPGRAANWYGQTKLEGERAALKANPAAAVVRPSLPYGPAHPRKRDIVRLVRSRLGAGEAFAGAVDQFISPTWLDDLGDGLAAIVAGQGSGAYHLAGATLLTPYDAALVVARTFGLDERLVRPATLAEISGSGRAPRPRATALLCPRFDRELGGRVRRRGFAEGVGLLRDLELQPAPPS